MVDLNHVVLIGRLTRDAELKSIASGQSVCKFSIAVNRRRKNGDQWEDEANFFDIVVWGRQGESLHQYLVKGKMIAVDGELRQDRWQQDGQTRSKVEVIANNLKLGGGGSGGSSGGGSDNGGFRVTGGGHSSSYGNDGGFPPPSRERGDRGDLRDRSPAEDSFADDIPF